MYKSIFRTDEVVDHHTLLEEFNTTMNEHLKVVYPKLESWTGVVVYERNGKNELERLPELRKVVDTIGRENIAGVTYFKLKEGAIQHEHRDMYGNLLFDCSRIHIPLQTNAKAFLMVERVEYNLGLGELWCLDTSGRHAAKNEGDNDRIHLVIDVLRCPATEKYFPSRNFETRLHLCKFCVIMGWNVLRDSVLRPKSVLKRVRGLRKLLGRSA